MTSLFEPCQVGTLALSTRIVMAPLTRNRAPGALANARMATYYRQRAHPARGAGLIITETTAISHQGQGYADVPGIWSAEQVAAWKALVEAKAWPQLAAELVTRHYDPAYRRGGEGLYRRLAEGQTLAVPSLDAATLARIWAGQITRWNDPVIQGANAASALPDAPISVVVRGTKSGTTDSALPTATSTSTTTNGVVQWKCMAKGAAAFVTVSVPTDALDAKYVPSDCK